MPVALVALIVFALAVAFNALNAMGIRAVADGHRWRAAAADLVLGSMAFVFLWAFVSAGWWTVGPELAGGFLGTAWGTRPAKNFSAPEKEGRRGGVLGGEPPRRGCS